MSEEGKNNMSEEKKQKLKEIPERISRDKKKSKYNNYNLIVYNDNE